MNTKLPTEREILKVISHLYKADYPGRSPGENDPYLKIDIKIVAEKIKCKPELLFGYLYYYLDHKHRYSVGENNWTQLFALKVGEKLHCVNYPYLIGILAAHEVEHKRNLWAFGLSLAAVVISGASILAQVLISIA